MFDLTADKIVNIADDAGIMALLGVGADIAPVMALLGVGADIAPVSEEGPEFKAALIKALEAEPDQPAQTLFLSVTMELGIKDAAPLEVYFAVFLAVWRELSAFIAAPPSPPAAPKRPAPVPGGKRYGMAEKITDKRNPFAKTGFRKK